MPSWQKYVTVPGVAVGATTELTAEIRYFKQPTGALLGIYAASFVLPSIFTAFIGDYLSTKFGRRACILIANAIILAGALINTFTVSIGMWCAGTSMLTHLEHLALIDCTSQVVPSWELELASSRFPPLY
jgi:MFS family permease